MSAAVFGVCIFIAVIMQSTFADFMQVLGVKPDLVLITMVCIALLRGYREGATYGLFAGALKDILFCKFFGLFSLLWMYAGLAVGTINKKVFKENVLVAIITSFLTTLISEIIYYFFTSYIAGRTEFIFFLKTIILPQAVYNGTLTLPVFLGIVLINRKISILEDSRRKY